MKQYGDLTALQKKSLLRFPAYISLLATSDSKIDQEERKVAIKLAHTKAFACRSMLAEFCRESENVFETNLTQLEAILPTDKKSRDEAIRKELVKLEKLLLKLGPEYAFVMHQSMKTFKDHISMAHHSVIEDFILPIAIPGLTD